MTWINNYELIQSKLNIMKLKPRLGALYVIGPGNGSHIFYSSWKLRNADVNILKVRVNLA